MALLPMPGPAPLAQISTVHLEFLGIPLQQRVLHEANGTLTAVGHPHLRSDHLWNSKFDTAVERP